MDAVLLALASAVLFGATTVAMRVAFRAGGLAEGGALFTVLVAIGVVLPVAVVEGGFTTDVWPFLVAGLLGPGISQFLFTFAVREAGRRADVGRHRHGAALLDRHRLRSAR